MVDLGPVGRAKGWGGFLRARVRERRCEPAARASERALGPKRFEGVTGWTAGRVQNSLAPAARCAATRHIAWLQARRRAPNCIALLIC